MPEDSDSGLERRLAAHGPFEKAPAFRRGDRIGDWRVLAFIGRGATSEVYRAENEVMRQIGAVKVLMRGEDRALARFRREVVLLAETDGAAFPRFYGAGECDGRAYFATELLEPVDLPSSDAAVARFILGVCAGVESLHRRGFVHRDIKPGNVMLRPSTGEPVLIDMGLAKEVGAVQNTFGDTLSVVDGHAVGVGTIGFSAPEQFVGGRVDATADIHALGMLANACFGRKPPKAWAEIVRRATSSAPEQRYATAADFARAVRTRHRARHALMAVAAASVVVAAVIAGLSRGDAETRRMVEQPDTGLLRQEGRAYARPNASNHVEPSGLEPVAVETADDLLALGESRIVNGDRVTVVELRGRDIKLSKETHLTGKRKIIVVGPGRLTGAISGVHGASVELKNRAMLDNLTTTPYPASAMKYVLTGEAYLNFKNLDRPADGDIKNVLAEGNEGDGLPIVDFRGPDAIDFEKAKSINDAAWEEAVKSGSVGKHSRVANQH